MLETRVQFSGKGINFLVILGNLRVKMGLGWEAHPAWQAWLNTTMTSHNMFNDVSDVIGKFSFYYPKFEFSVHLPILKNADAFCII